MDFMWQLIPALHFLHNLHIEKIWDFILYHIYYI